MVFPCTAEHSSKVFLIGYSRPSLEHHSTVPLSDYLCQLTVCSCSLNVLWLMDNDDVSFVVRSPDSVKWSNQE